ncbi:hypothetical protein [Actinacidiphila sp. bgisy145]|uniref:hypothetical protein n=1 Tax=Actinacidiphila sp. bgisy145 TaxID=3413792 RepID=UPI003EBAB841
MAAVGDGQRAMRGLLRTYFVRTLRVLPAGVGLAFWQPELPRARLHGGVVLPWEETEEGVEWEYFTVAYWVTGTAPEQVAGCMDAVLRAWDAFGWQTRADRSSSRTRGIDARTRDGYELHLQRSASGYLSLSGTTPRFPAGSPAGKPLPEVIEHPATAQELRGAWEQLIGDGIALRAEILALAAALTPGQRPDVVLRDPSVVDWHDPLKYRYSTAERVVVQGGLDVADVLDRAAAWLAGRGWATERGTEALPVRGADAALVSHVAGTRGGSEIRVRVEEGHSGVLYLGRTAARPLYVPVAFVPPPPERTAETVSRGYVLCHECAGRGWCPLCEGRGWIIGERGRGTCPECDRRRDCPICSGRGQLVAAELDTWERRLYPELGEHPVAKVCGREPPVETGASQQATPGVGGHEGDK